MKNVGAITRTSKNLLNENMIGKESDSKKREDLTSLGSDDSGKIIFI